MTNIRGLLLILFFQETNVMNKMQGTNFVQLTNEASAEAKLALTMPCKEEEDEVK
jgi:hypothetical protein